jgi:2-methylcitrate dehydratase PrpD
LAPKTIVEAQFSIPYTVAAAWIDGGLGMRHFSDEGLQRADVLALAQRVRPHVDAEIERDWSRFVTPARVRIEFEDGSSLETRIDYPKGHPRNAMTVQEFASKTADCATFAAVALAGDTAERLTQTVRSLETLTDVGDLIRIMTPPVTAST